MRTYHIVDHEFSPVLGKLAVTIRKIPLADSCCTQQTHNKVKPVKQEVQSA
jgi:hypothetical protein